jgi:hypothetical protein
VVFFEDFEDVDISTMRGGWEDDDNLGMMSFDSAVPTGAVPGSQALAMDVPAEISGITNVSLYSRHPSVQQGAVYIRYYVRYDEGTTNYHHTGMWLGGYNPSLSYPVGYSGRTPDGTDFFHNAFEPMDNTLALDQYVQWPDMGCWRPDPQCYGNNMLHNAEPVATQGEWACHELMLKLNTPGLSDGEFQIWIDDQEIQHLKEGSPLMSQFGDDSVWGPDPAGSPFPGFNWRSTIDLGANWLWPHMYVDDGPAGVTWDQIVVATERIGCMEAAGGAGG